MIILIRKKNSTKMNQFFFLAVYWGDKQSYLQNVFKMQCIRFMQTNMIYLQITQSVWFVLKVKINYYLQIV